MRSSFTGTVAVNSASTYVRSARIMLKKALVDILLLSNYHTILLCTSITLGDAGFYYFLSRLSQYIIKDKREDNLTFNTATVGFYRLPFKSDRLPVDS